MKFNTSVPSLFMGLVFICFLLHIIITNTSIIIIIIVIITCIIIVITIIIFMMPLFEYMNLLLFSKDIENSLIVYYNNTEFSDLHVFLEFSGKIECVRMKKKIKQAFLFRSPMVGLYCS